MLLQFFLLLYLQFGCPVNVEFHKTFIFNLFAQKNLTAKSNMVNVLLIFNASAMLIAPLSPILLHCKCYTNLHFHLIVEQIKKNSPANTVL